MNEAQRDALVGFTRDMRALDEQIRELQDKQQEVRKNRSLFMKANGIELRDVVQVIDSAERTGHL